MTNRFFITTTLQLLCCVCGWSMPVEVDAGVPVIQGSVDVNGQTSDGWFIVDTGSTRTVLYSDDLFLKAPSRGAERVAVNAIDSPREAVEVVLSELSFGGQTFHDPKILVFLSRASSGMRKILGVLGLDLLAQRPLLLSLTSREIAFAPPSDLKSWELCTDFLPVSEDHPYWSLASHYGIYDTDFLFDTGAYGNTVPFDKAFDHAMFSPKQWQGSFDWAKPPILFGVAKMPSLEGRDFGNGFVVGSAIPIICAIGNQVLSAWDWFFDPVSQSLYRRAVPDADHIGFRNNWNRPSYSTAPGFTLDKETHEVTIVFRWGNNVPVLPQVMVGDTLVSVDGVPLASIANVGEVLDGLKKARLGFLRKNDPYEIEIDSDNDTIDYQRFLADPQ